MSRATTAVCTRRLRRFICDAMAEICTLGAPHGLSARHILVLEVVVPLTVHEGQLVGVLDVGACAVDRVAAALQHIAPHVCMIDQIAEPSHAHQAGASEQLMDVRIFCVLRVAEHTTAPNISLDEDDFEERRIDCLQHLDFSTLNVQAPSRNPARCMSPLRGAHGTVTTLDARLSFCP